MIKILVMDVDGTLTDGKINISEKGELFKSFNVKDGYGIANLLPKMNILPVIITGRNSEIVKERCKDLNIELLYQGINDKIFQLKEVLYKLNLTADQVAYIGDDLNDLDCLEYVGISACPSDAVSLVKERVNYICKNKGGNGAVREFIDWLAMENK